MEPDNRAAVRIDNDDIGGVVTSAKGPEAGARVIAETRDLPTRFARMVVTDERGRYVIPDLPKASYDVYPGAGFQAIGDNSAESSYYLWDRSAQHLRAWRRRANVDR